MLLDQGADINETALHGWSPLIVAARVGSIRIIKILLERGANIDQASNVGWTPLMMATFVGEVEAIKVLLDYGADTKPKSTALTTKGATAEELAPLFGRAQLAKVIREYVRSPKVRPNSPAAKALLDAKMAKIRAHTEAGDQARKAGDNPTALKNYVAALGEAPPGAEIKRELRMKIIRFARSMKKPPPVPEDAKYHSLRAQAFLKMAKDKGGYEKAKKELEAAVRIAPWWGDAYFNLGLVQEKLHDYQPAIENLKLYLAAAPNARDIGAIKKKLVELEVAQELAQ